MSQDAPKANPLAAVFCSECGTKNDGAAKFCKNCGKPLATGHQLPAAAVQPAPLPPTAPQEFVPPVSTFTGPVGELIAQRMLSPPPRPGLLAILDHYEILRVLGGGGMGIVLLARDADTGREVAIKVVKSDLVTNQHVVHRFLKEAGHLKRLRHTNIVPVLEISDRAESPYFVMPYFEKGSLANRIKSGQPLDSESVLDIATQVAEGLSFAHRSGIIHRDLKPANILLGTNGEVCLGDFGLARTMFNDTIVDVESRHLEGTAPYMSPAVAAGEAEDTRCDIYSFGALLYEMLTGQPPYKGRGPKEILDQILAGPPKPITSLNPAADGSLVAVAEGCIARELRDRYADMRDVLKDLQRIKESKPPIGQRKTKRVWTVPRIVWVPACIAGAALLLWAFWPKHRPTITLLPSSWTSISALEPVGNSVYLVGLGNSGETFGVYSNGTFTDLSSRLPASWSAARAIAYGDNKLLIGGIQTEPGAAHGRIGVFSLASGNFQDMTLGLSDFYYGLNSTAFNGSHFLIGGAGQTTSLQLFSPTTGRFTSLTPKIPFYFAVNNIVPLGNSFLIAGAGPGPGPGQPPALGLISGSDSFTDLRSVLPPGYGGTSYLAYNGRQVFISGWDAATGTSQMWAILDPSSWASSPVAGLPASLSLHSIDGGNGVFLVGGQLNGEGWLASYIPGSPPTSLVDSLPVGTQDITAIKFAGNGFILSGIDQRGRIFLTMISGSVLHSAFSESQPKTRTSNIVYKVARGQSAASIATLAGQVGGGGYADGAGPKAQFRLPNNVAVDSADNVYVADTANNVIRRITPNGVVSTLAGLAGSHGSADGAGSNARFWAPFGIAVDRAGNVYVADTANNTIRKITPERVVSTLAGLAGHPGSNDGIGSAARFRNPWGVAADRQGDVFVADMSNDTIRKITPAGVVTTLAGRAGISGSAVGFGSNARFNSPFAVAVDNEGNVYVSDSGNNTVRKIMPDRVVVPFAGWPGYAGNTDGSVNDARFRNPRGLAVDSAGIVYVADSGNNTIREITPSGVVTTLPELTGDTGGDARLNSPGGVAVDSAGNVYVADTDNHCVRKITASPSANP